jgi:branched-chain amino acid transport system substrate-binding protein
MKGIALTRNNRFGVAVSLAALAAVGLSSCSTTKDDTADSGCDAKVVYFGALTGGAAALGINAANGAELAVEQYNKEQSKADCVDFEKIDSQSDPKQAPGLAAKVIKDKKVLGVMGPLFSGESEAADPVFDKAGLPIISASATKPTLSESGWKVFHRVLGNDATQGPMVSVLIKEVAKVDNVFIVEDDSAYGKGLSEQVQKDMRNGVVGVEGVKTGETNFSGVINSITAKKPKSVFFSGYYPEAGPFVKQLRAAGYKGVVVTADGVKDPEFIKLSGADAAEGTLITCPCVPGENLKAFNAAYVEKFDTAPGTYSPEAYDAMNIFLDGIKSGVKDRAGMLKFVNEFDGDGITKHLKFDAKGEPTEIPVWGYRVEGGQIVPIKLLN